MMILITTALAVAQPAAVQTAPAPAAHSQMGQTSSKKEECCCKDKMGKEHSNHDMDRMHDHQDHPSR